MPDHMPVCASTGPVLVLCYQHWPSTGPVLAHNGMFRGYAQYILYHMILRSGVYITAAQATQIRHNRHFYRLILIDKRIFHTLDYPFDVHWMLIVHPTHSRKHAVMCQYRACTGPMLSGSDQYRFGTGN